MDFQRLYRYTDLFYKSATEASDVEKQVKQITMERFGGTPPGEEHVTTPTKEHVQISQDALSKISLLDSRFQPLARRFLEAAADKGIQLGISQGYRTVSEQNAIYEKGRTVIEYDKNGKPKPPATNAKGGNSLHNYGLAIDIVPIENGKYQWNKPNSFWQELGQIGKGLGLLWGPEATGLKYDVGHFQYPITMADIVTGKFKPEKTGR